MAKDFVMFINSLDKLLSHFVTQAAPEETGTVRQFPGKRQQNRLCVVSATNFFLFREMCGQRLWQGETFFLEITSEHN